MTTTPAGVENTRPQFDSEYLFGIHEPGGEAYMLAAEKPGWIVFNEVVGHNPEDQSGLDFSAYSKRGLGVICCINHGYEPDGVLPHSSLYEAFARRVATFVNVSRGCKTWVIGSEMNYAVQRPGIVIDWTRHQTTRSGPPEIADPLRRGLPVRFNVLPDPSTEIRTTRIAMISPGEPITPDFYARCYRLCRDAIRLLPGHQDDLVLVGAVAPWNTQTVYTGNPNGDWVLYFRHILDELGPGNCDGFALHTCTHGADPTLIASPAKLPPPFQAYHQQFRVFTDFLAAVPAPMRHLPAFITEMDQSTPWHDANDGWVQRAYAEIDGWNRAQIATGSPQRVRCAALYRWPAIDRWFIDGKRGLIEDFCEALTNEYRWHDSAPVPVPQPLPQPSPAPAPSPARRPAFPPLPPYRIEWIDDHFPARITAGQTITVQVTLKNVGGLTWRRIGGNPVRLGYRFLRNKRRIDMPPDREIRSDLPHDVESGELVTIDATIALPAEAGNYTIELDLVHEGVGWFKERKSSVLSRWLTIEAAAPVALDGGEPLRNLPVPLFLDVSAKMPRSESPYARRSLNQIKYLVISHTAANSRLPLERIARAHIAVGYPGIAYTFVVDGAGQVLRVSDLESVAQPDQSWSEQGVNIALVGNFSATMPALQQIDAAGRLCAWLAQNLGLSPDAIVGLGELTKSDNPGPLFYRGPTWKQMIIRQVQLHLAALGVGAADSERMQRLLATAQDLEERNRSLAEQIETLHGEQERLQATNEQLNTELNEARRLAQSAAQPGARTLPIQNVVNTLPRQASRYRRRWPNDVQTIVIHHTGMAADTALALLADAHRREWPGLLYDFYIDAYGAIFQTQPLDEVVASDEPFLVHGLNVALAGAFEDTSPPRAQIAACARLIAWLMDRFPDLGVDQVKGLNELVASDSPGKQWNSGLRWKESLLVALRRELGQHDTAEIEANLRARIGEIERQLEQAQRTVASSHEVRLRLESENQRLQEELVARSPQAASYVIPQPALRMIADQLPRHPTLRYERRARSQITHIAVHHTAAPPTLPPSRIAEMHIQADPMRGKEPWPGIGYHYFVHADGAIEQTNTLETASYHVYRHNPYSLGVAFAGSFMNGKIPTSAQLRAGGHLLAWLMQELNIPLARVWGHREFPDNVTVCPGSEWTQGNRWRDLLFERIEQVKKGVGVKSIRHYVLLWQRTYPGPMAQQDLSSVVPYMARFRPALGFSIEDARNAEYVTIIGGEAGVSAGVECMLDEHGCRVERIAGRNDEETGRMLAEMAQQGRRFLRYDVDF